MNDLRSPPNRGGFPRPPEDVDGLLRRFFRSEMPEPWPEAPTVPTAAPRKRPQRVWFRLSHRFALAAAVALFLIGYLTLAGRFPTTGPTRQPIPGETGFNPHRDPIPPKPKIELLRPEVVPIRNGGEAKIRGARTTGPRRTIYLHVERIR
jgi:hypothetical protein